MISDWEMPGMSGIELLRACKSDHQLSKIPFLMVAAQSPIENLRVSQAARANVDDYLLKPFQIAEFRQKITDVLTRAGRSGKGRKKRSLLLGRSHFKAVLELVRLFEQIGEGDRALAFMQKTCKNLESVPEAHFELGLLYYGRGQFDLCKAEFAKTLELNGDHPEAKLMLEVLGI